MSGNIFDIAVIGGGPGGYVAAIRAAQLGLNTVLIEREHLGGICLNWGCIPTKALLRSSEIYHLLHRLDEFGLEAGNVSFNLEKIVARSRQVAGQLSSGIRHLMKKNKVTVIEGHGALAGKGTVRVKQEGAEPAQTVTAKHIILATGARARTLPGVPLNHPYVWTYKEAMTPDVMPKRLLVVGSGAIGMEFASFYRALGAEVTVIEMQNRILPVEDAEISAMAKKAFEAQGMVIKPSTTLKGLQVDNEQVTATLESGGAEDTLTVDRVITAIGIIGNTENLGLEETQARVDRGHVVIDEWCQTGEPGVYAIGDLAGPPWLAHKASHEGMICVEKIAGVEGVHPLDTGNIPGCTYCHPQIASVGMTEVQAIEAGHTVKVGRFPYIGNGKAIALGEPEGMVKTIFDDATGELLGAHMIGADVTELIQGYAIARTLETTEAELMHTVFPHPTLSEMMHESVLDAYGRAVHF